MCVREWKRKIKERQGSRKMGRKKGGDKESVCNREGGREIEIERERGRERDFDLLLLVFIFLPDLAVVVSLSGAKGPVPNFCDPSPKSNSSS